MRVCCFVERERPPTRSMTSKFSLDNFVAATHVALCTPDSRRPHRSNHCRRQNLELGVCINFIDPPDASDAQSLLPNRDGPVASSCAIDQSHKFKCRDLPRRFRGSCPGSAWRATAVPTTEVWTAYDQRHGQAAGSRRHRANGPRLAQGALPLDSLPTA